MSCLASARSSLSLCALSALLAASCSVDTDNLFTGGAGGGPSSGGNGTGAEGGTSAAGANGPGGSGDGAGPQGGRGEGGVTTTLSGAECGDGTQNGNEQCDGADLAGSDCTDLGFDEPRGLQCDGSCNFDPSGCQSATECGNGTPEGDEECDDGNQEPNDGCSAACKVDGTCQTAIAFDLNPGPLSIVGSTLNGGSQENTSNDLPYCQGSSGPELVFRITAQGSGIFTAYLPSSGTPFDAVLYAKPGCEIDEGICHDNYGTSSDEGGEVLSFAIDDGDSFYLYVDGFNPSESGPFQLELDLSTGDTCADPVPIVVEGDAPIHLFGNTQDGTQNGASTGLSCTGAGAGADLIYDVTTTETGSYTFETFAQYNSVLHARSSCADGDTQITCSSPTGDNDATMTFGLDDGDSTAVWVDGVTGAAGTYMLQITH